MTTTSVELTPSQLEIARSIIDSKAFRTTLAGLAGTGKTTVARYIYEQLVAAGREVCVMGPTGKSAVVLRSKGVPATTIHSAIYHYKGQYENLQGEIELIFRDNNKGKFCDYFMVDESSMLTERQVKDIEARNTQVLYIGDPGQLPPVKSRPNGLFEKPTHILREIHRQAAGSPIIKFAYALRKGASLSNPFEGITHIPVRNQGPVFVASKMLDCGIDRLVVRSNMQRVLLNMAYRGIVDRRGVVAVGDEIICIQNNKLLDVVNGEIFRVTDVFTRARDWTEIGAENVDTGENIVVKVWNAQFGQERRVDTEEVDQIYMLADYAYAITCHKMQGSSARHVGIAARGAADQEAKWNYTAATRAEQDITVFC